MQKVVLKTFQFLSASLLAYLCFLAYFAIMGLASHYFFGSGVDITKEVVNKASLFFGLIFGIILGVKIIMN